jgi:hypothetical protein
MRWLNSENSLLLGKLDWCRRLTCRYIRVKYSYVCRTKQGTKTRTLWGISWIRRMCNIIDEMPHKPRSLYPSSAVYNWTSQFVWFGGQTSCVSNNARDFPDSNPVRYTDHSDGLFCGSPPFLQANFGMVLLIEVDRDSLVGMAIRCMLEGRGIESRWRRNFRHPPRPALGPSQRPAKWVPCFSPGEKRPGALR